jgi:hypothetical protein
MARGGKRLGAGRPKGSTQRPQLRDYIDEEELADFIELIKTHMVEDMTILRFVGEQIRQGGSSSKGNMGFPLLKAADAETPIPLGADTLENQPWLPVLRPVSRQKITRLPAIRGQEGLCALIYQLQNETPLRFRYTDATTPATRNRIPIIKLD